MSLTISTTAAGTDETVEPRVRVRIERGQRGGYGWEITVRGDDAGDVLREIENTDHKLRATYLTSNTLDFNN